MPYNTRRKSLSLPSLGIHIPVTHAARAAAAAAAAASRAAVRPSTSPSASSGSPAPSDRRSDRRSESPESHPNKRIKRSHVVSSVEALPVEQTPPPSPTAATSVETSDSLDIRKIDIKAINDDIVEAVVIQLQSTGNRPHLIKELATVLSQRLASVQK